MCIILDASCFGSFRDERNKDMKPIRDWLDTRNGKIAYSNTDKFEREWKQGGLNYRERYQAGQLKLIPKEEVRKKQAELDELDEKLKSNDPHIIALALVAKVKVLVVQRQPHEPGRGRRPQARGADPPLQRDFKRLARGKVYMDSSHKHLLTQDTCP